MSRLPSVGVEHVDVSALLQEVAALREEVRSFAVRSDMAAMRQTRSCVPQSQMTPHQCETVAVRDISDVAPGMAADTATFQTAAASIVQVSGSSSSPSYAALASSLKDSVMMELPCTEDAKKKPPSYRPVVGRSTNTSRLKSVTTRKPVDIFVTRLLPDTEVENVVATVNDVLRG